MSHLVGSWLSEGHEQQVEGLFRPGPWRLEKEQRPSGGSGERPRLSSVVFDAQAKFAGGRCGIEACVAGQGWQGGVFGGCGFRKARRAQGEEQCGEGKCR